MPWNLMRFHGVFAPNFNHRACIEDPLLIAKILGHVQQREALNESMARAPPGHHEHTFGLN